MLASIKSELRKLLSIRSTYIWVATGLAFIVLYAGYFEGYKLKAAELVDPNLLTSDIVGALTSLPLVFGAIVAVLLVTHEYRHNTIMYTLTASNSRTKSLFAKFLVGTIFALLLTAVAGALSPVMTIVGAHLHGHTLGMQHLEYHSIVWRALVSGTSYIVLTMLLAMIIRNQIGAIVAIFIIPTAEQIVGNLLLKSNMVYLPFTAANSLLSAPGQGSITHAHAAMVVAGYVVVGWIVAWLLFVKRDAN